MSAHVGILSDDKSGLATPTGGYAHKVSRKTSRDYVRTKNESGVTADVSKIPYQTQEVTMSGVGIVDMSLVTSGTTVAGTLKITSAKRTESSKGLKGFEYGARKRINDT